MTILPHLGLESFGVEGGTDTARFHCGCSVRFFFRMLIGQAFIGHTSTDHRKATLCSKEHAITLVRLVMPDGATREMDRDFDRLTYDVPS